MHSDGIYAENEKKMIMTRQVKLRLRYACTKASGLGLSYFLESAFFTAALRGKRWVSCALDACALDVGFLS